MIKPRHIEKFWNTLVAGNGSANYYTIGRQVFGGSWKRAWVEEIAQAPALAGLVTTSTERVHLSGRIPLRYTLTPRGWDLARTWKLLPPAGDLPPEELRRQVERLAATMNPWAEELLRMANYGRKRMSEADTAPKERKKRHRSPRQQEKSRQFIERKVAERLRDGAVTPPKPEVQPTPSWAPTPLEPKRIAPSAPVAAVEPPWWISAGISQSVRPVPQSAPAPSTEASELERVKRAGYQVNARGEVLYDNAWVSLSRWKSLMPGVLE